MSMMGSTPVGGGGLSFEDVIKLFKDEPAYQAKLRDMQKRTEEAKAHLVQAVELSRKIEEEKKLVQSMLDQTTQQVLEANRLKEAAEKQAAETAQREKDLTAQHEAWKKQADAELENGRAALRDAFVAREKEVAAKEQKLLADIKEFEAIEADRHDRAAEFYAHSDAKERELAKKREQLDAALAEASARKDESEKIRQQLQDKLDKIKSISVG